MHEFHAWIGLAESAEESDLGGLAEAVGELEDLAADSKWHDAVFEVRNLNGQYFLRADGMVNRRREEGERLDLFLAVIARRLPGSWGLVYERDDEMPDPPGPNAFRVRVLARGSVVERPDPFLSPIHPMIEDLPCSPGARRSTREPGRRTARHRPEPARTGGTAPHRQRPVQQRDRATLVISQETAKTYVSRILTKLDLPDRVQAVVYAYRNGLVT